MNKFPVIVALDGIDHERAISIAKICAGKVWGFKIHELFLQTSGAELLRELKTYGNVFIDLKLHDIPQTVEYEVATLLSFEIDLISIHASGGVEMCKAAVRAGGAHIACVTALTSLSPQETISIYGVSPEEAVTRLTQIAVTSGVQNIICSPHEVGRVRAIAPNATIVTPGIRKKGSELYDQHRTMSAQEALKEGSDLLVIGRPITKAPDILRALETMFED